MCTLKKNNNTKQTKIKYEDRESTYIHTLRTSELFSDTDDNLCHCLYVLQSSNQSKTSDTYIDTLFMNNYEENLSQDNASRKRKTTKENSINSDIFNEINFSDASIEESPQYNSDKVSHYPNKYLKKSMRQNVPLMGTKILSQNKPLYTDDSNDRIRSLKVANTAQKPNNEDSKIHTTIYNQKIIQNDNNIRAPEILNPKLTTVASKQHNTKDSEHSIILDEKSAKIIFDPTDPFNGTFIHKSPCLQHDEGSFGINHHRIGMSNPDNKCHANALFQAILYDLITEFQEADSYKRQRQCTCIGCVLIKTTNIYNINNQMFYPSLYHTWVSNNRPLNTPFRAQEDVHELFETIRSQLINFHQFPGKRHRSGNTFYKPISNKFMGEIISKIYCNNCSNGNEHSDPFSDLTLSISNSIYLSLISYFQTENLEDYKCDHCNRKHSSIMKNEILSLPEILCISIKRYNNQGEKIHDKTFIDQTLDLTRFLSKKSKNRVSEYKLISYVCHTGNESTNGHYFTSRLLEDDSFMILDDEKIYKTNSQLENQSAVYLLFYRLLKEQSVPLPPKVNILNKVVENDIKQERFLKLKNDIKTGDNNPEVTSQLDNLIFNNTDIFHIDGDKLTYCDILEHSIPLYSDVAPVNIKPYSRRSKWEKEKLEEKVKELLDLGIIVPSRSPFNSPLHLVKKGKDKDGNVSTRLVVDFSKLNSITVSETYPADQVIDILDQLKNSRIFSSLDMKNGYLQVRMKESCRHKTAFSSGYHHYMFLRMPLGLRSSSHTFNRLIRIALADLIGKILYIFLDDVIVYSSSVPEHMERLQTLFSTLRKHNLKLSATKCNLLRFKLKFLGFIVSADGVLPDPDKVIPIVNFPQPKTHKAIKSFLGMCGYYRRHVPQFSEHAKPMNNLLKKNVKFLWSDACEQSFQYFKNCLTHPPILQFPDFDKTFILTTDASIVAVSAILSQGNPPDDLPIAYASRTLLDAETRYVTSEIEISAILFAIRHFKTYIGFSHFIIKTDCQALQWLQQVKSPNSRLLKWKLKLAGYDFEIKHIKGTHNTVADCLSRYIEDIPTPSINMLTRAKTKQSLDQANPLYVTPEQNRENISNNKRKVIDIHKLPVVLESSDKKLATKFPTQLLICDISDKNTLQTHNVDLNQIKPGEVVYKEQLNIILIITQGISIDFTLLSNSLITLKNLCDKFNLQRILFTRISFHGTSREFESIKKTLLYEFENTTIRFLFLKNSIIELTNLDEISQVLKDFHDGPLGGHQGVHRMADKISTQYKWEGLHKDVQNFVRNCPICQKTKPKGLHKQHMQITSTSLQPFVRLATDVTGPLLESPEGFKYILTFQDDLTKFFGAVPMIDHTADSVARGLVEQAILRYGIPETILSDLGSEYINNLFSKIMKLLGIKHYTTSGYHPETNGSIERQNSILKSILRSQVGNILNSWPQFLPYAVFIINSQINSSTGFSPFELIYGYKLAIPTNLKRKPEPIYTYDNYLTELRYKLQLAHSLARENLISSKIHNKNYYDTKTRQTIYKIGDMVLITNEDRKTKLHNPFIGPYKVIDIISEVNIKIRIKNRDKIVHINRTKLYNENKQLMNNE